MSHIDGVDLSRGLAVNKIDETREHVRVAVRKNAVTKIEDVSLGAAPRGEHSSSPGLDHLPRRQRDRRIKVALDGAPRPDPAGGHIEGEPPIDTDDVRAGRAQQTEEFARPHSKVDLRDTMNGGESGSRVREDVPLVVVRGQDASPRVEELDGTRAGLHLDSQEL